jgi:hypothetical protein
VAVTADASSGVEAKAIGAAIIGVVMPNVITRIWVRKSKKPTMRLTKAFCEWGVESNHN